MGLVMTNIQISKKFQNMRKNMIKTNRRKNCTQKLGRTITIDIYKESIRIVKPNNETVKSTVKFNDINNLILRFAQH